MHVRTVSYDLLFKFLGASLLRNKNGWERAPGVVYNTPLKSGQGVS
jgi:hypothetical protein